MLYTAKLNHPERNPDLLRLLSDFELTLPEGADEGLGLYEDEALVGCGFLKGNMLQGLAVDRDRQGEGLSATLVTALIQLAAGRGIRHLNVITKPSMAGMLAGLGLRRVADAPPYAAFLEFGSPGAPEYAAGLRALAAGKPEDRACLVMNCNPFTRGHRYLVERASWENGWVFVLAVQEDLSTFPFRDRLRLMEEGLRDLPNVTVASGGEYCVSSLTFPSYFTREERLAAAQAAMDAELFCQLVAPALGVKRRYVGTEPVSRVTAVYNRTLHERLPRRGIQVVELERLPAADGRAVSASSVRAALRAGDWEAVRELVPDVTWTYLRSPEAAPALERLGRED